MSAQFLAPFLAAHAVFIGVLVARNVITRVVGGA